jgi:hypothetical protein
MNRHSPFQSHLLLLSAICVSLVGCQQEQTEPSIKTQIISIDVHVAFQGRHENITQKINLNVPATALDALREIAKLNNIDVQFKGNGETAFVYSIDGVENLGTKGDNWTYRVNDQLGDRSSDVYNVKEGDKVTWMFGKYPLSP